MTASAMPSQSVRSRNVAIDAYRGFVMLLMLAEVLRLSEVALHFPHSLLWRVLAYNQSHVEWVGMSLHDTIQPSFTFLVGVALQYSLSSRRRRGDSFARQLVHTVWRSLVLITLGIFLRSTHSPITNFTFEDTLTQIGLGYTFAFFLAQLSSKWVWVALATILLGYWLAWAMYPLPPTHYDYASLVAPSAWQEKHLLRGFAAHWNKNANFGQAMDIYFLNLFPRIAPFQFNDGGYVTLSFIPTLGTILLGLLTGRWLIDRPDSVPFRKLLLNAAWLIAVGLLLHLLGINPIVKRIWTPAWTLYSGGVCLILLSAFSWIIDVRENRRLAFPLVVIGTNSLAAYLMAHLWEDFIEKSLHTHLGPRVLSILGIDLEPLVSGSLVLMVYYLVLLWMYRNRTFLRV